MLKIKSSLSLNKKNQYFYLQLIKSASVFYGIISNSKKLIKNRVFSLFYVENRVFPYTVLAH